MQFVPIRGVLSYQVTSICPGGAMLTLTDMWQAAGPGAGAHQGAAASLLHHAVEHDHLMTAGEYRHARAQAFQLWREETRVQAAA